MVPSPAGVVESTESLVWRKLGSCGRHSEATTYSGLVKFCGLSKDGPLLIIVKVGALLSLGMFLGGPKLCTIAEMRSTAVIVLLSLLAGMIREKTLRKITLLFVEVIPRRPLTGTEMSRRIVMRQDGVLGPTTKGELASYWS